MTRRSTVGIRLAPEEIEVLREAAGDEPWMRFMRRTAVEEARRLRAERLDVEEALAARERLRKLTFPGEEV